MQFKSYAKLNIGLLITGKRETGFHELYSIFQEIDLYDIISIEVDGDGHSITITSNSKIMPIDSSNTVYKAAEHLMPLINKNLKIHIDKKLPSEAGIGGGSGNAAYTLIYLNKMFNLGLDKNELLNYAEKIGSDVPFFIHGRQALVWGRGEFMKTVSYPFPYHIVLLKPKGFSCSTKEIFEGYKPFLTEPVNKVSIDTFLENSSKENLLNLENHLERPLVNKYPIINHMKKTLYEHGAFYSSMTGSGSVVFGLFDDKPHIEEDEAFNVFYTNAIV